MLPMSLRGRLSKPHNGARHANGQPYRCDCSISWTVSPTHCHPMLGTLRLVLALLVALSHANVKIGGLNPGVMSVVCFYLISGYVMTGLLRDHYSNVRRIPYFYLDRALRIFPQYLAIAG